MNNLSTYLTLFAAVAVLGGCGGRVAKPISVATAFDSELSCSHLHGEYQNHDKRLVELTGERKDKTMHNVGMFLSSPIFLDLSQAQKYEAQAIYKRQERLRDIMKNKSCIHYQDLDFPETTDIDN
ncbi:MAG: hypothetical protein ABJN69_03775 [Hellea sp.]